MDALLCCHMFSNCTHPQCGVKSIFLNIKLIRKKKVSRKFMCVTETTTKQQQDPYLRWKKRHLRCDSEDEGGRSDWLRGERRIFWAEPVEEWVCFIWGAISLPSSLVLSSVMASLTVTGPAVPGQWFLFPARWLLVAPISTSRYRMYQRQLADCWYYWHFQL